MISGTLYRKFLSTPLLKCLEGEVVASFLSEVCEGVFGNGARALTKKVLRVVYYWPSMV